MTDKQRFGLILALVALVSIGLISVVVTFAFVGTKADASPTLFSVLGLFSTVVLLLVGVVQNQGQAKKTDAVAEAVNGTLVAKIEKVVHDVIAGSADAAPPLPPADPATTVAVAPPVELGRIS